MCRVSFQLRRRRPPFSSPTLSVGLRDRQVREQVSLWPSDGAEEMVIFICMSHPVGVEVCFFPKGDEKGGRRRRSFGDVHDLFIICICS